MKRGSSGDDFRRRADAVRGIALPTVLSHWDAKPHPRDRSQWLTDRGPLSVTGSKFFNWHLQRGGGGAIDLVMHLGGWDARAAVRWLEQHVCGIIPQSASTWSPSPADPADRSRSGSSRPITGRVPGPRTCQLCLPQADPARLPRVLRYLTQQRHLLPHILQPLVAAGKLYADRYGNAVFVMVAGKDNHPIGAELRGTGQRAWRGLAAGSRKDFGYFWIGTAGATNVVLCESAIDALSCYQLHQTKLGSSCICLSTAGVRSHIPWLRPLQAAGYRIYCGFDTDQPGEAASSRLIHREPSIGRLRPPAHDWNDALADSR